MKIRTRLALAFLVVAGLGFYLLVDWIVDDLRPRYLECMEESMVDTATVLAAFLSRETAAGGIETAELARAFDGARRRRFAARIYELTKTRIELRVTVADSEGRVIYDSEGRDKGRDFSRWNDVLLTLRGEYGARTTRRDPDDPRTAVLYVAAPVLAGDSIVGVLTVSKPTDSVTLFMDQARRKIVLGGLLAGVAVIVLGMIISAWITRPIERLTAYARAVGRGRRVRPPRLGRSEIGVLARAFEQMRDALEGKRYVERYVQTLTHEMKGPLSAIRGASELLQEDMPAPQRSRFAANIRAEAARLRDIVDRLLQLAALESRKALRDEETLEASALAAEVVASLEPAAAARQVGLSADPAGAGLLRGERFLLRQALTNLVQNALAFARPGGQVTVRARSDGGWVELVVEDDGAGVPDYALARAFERFYSLPRPDTGQKSSGLGLAFVREVALLHGGAARLENRAEGGARAVLRLPAAS